METMIEVLIKVNLPSYIIDVIIYSLYLIFPLRINYIAKSPENSVSPQYMRISVNSV